MKKAVRKKNNKKQVCSETHSNCQRRFGFVPVFQDLGDKRAWVLRRSSVFHFLGEFT